MVLNAFVPALDDFPELLPSFSGNLEEADKSNWVAGKYENKIDNEPSFWLSSDRC